MLKCFTTVGAIALSLLTAGATRAGITTSYWAQASADGDSILSEAESDALGRRVSYTRFPGYEPGQIVFTDSGWNALAAAEADLSAGLFRTHAYAMAYVSPAGDVDEHDAETHAEITLRETFTFSEPTTVQFSGWAHAYGSGRESAEGWANGWTQLDFNFERPNPMDDPHGPLDEAPPHEPSDEGGDGWSEEDQWFGYFYRQWGVDVLETAPGSTALPSPLPLLPYVDEPILSDPIAVPAGTLYFDLRLYSHAHASAWDGLASSHAQTASVNVDFGHTLFLEMLVPENVTVTSESGDFPIRPVPVPEPVSWTLAPTALLLLRHTRQRRPVA